MNVWDFRMMREAAERAAIRDKAKELGITEEELNRKIDEKRRAEWDRKQKEYEAEEAINQPKRDAIHRAIGDAAGLEIPLGIRPIRRRDSHYHLIAVDDGEVKGRKIAKFHSLCSPPWDGVSRYYEPESELQALFAVHKPIDVLKRKKTPEEWLEMATCRRCRRLAGLDKPVRTDEKRQTKKQESTQKKTEEKP